MADGTQLVGQIVLVISEQPLHPALVIGAGDRRRADHVLAVNVQ
jgi:hypothetical protein